jgi:hypothetical protein
VNELLDYLFSSLRAGGISLSLSRGSGDPHQAPADYKRLGSAPVEIAEFEDGQRIGTESGHYEWWYFDAHLDDGATVVVVFYTKPNVSPNGPPTACRGSSGSSPG